jgi:hypothetical protein
MDMSLEMGVLIGVVALVLLWIDWRVNLRGR